MDDPHDDPMVVAQRLMDKIREFVATLDDAERPLMAALLAPGVDAAWRQDPHGDDPKGEDPGRAGPGFELEWTPLRLPAHLCQEVRRAEVRITFAEPH